jgi:hypothetical protein
LLSSESDVLQPILRDLLTGPLRSPLGAAVGGPVAFPTDNIAAWFKKGIGITDVANAVSTWADQSGNGRNYTQATGSAQPIKQAAGTILFNGTSHLLKTAAFTLNQPCTRYLRVKPVTWTNGRYIFDGNLINRGVLFQTGVTPSVSLYAGAAAAPNTALTLGAWHSVAAVFNGATSVLQIDGTTTTGNAGASNPGGLTLGASPSSTLWSNVEVAEEIAYNVAHTPAQRAAVIKYLDTL